MLISTSCERTDLPFWMTFKHLQRKGWTPFLSCVFAEGQGILQPQTDPATLEHLSTFFSRCSSHEVGCYPPIPGCSGPSQFSQSHVCDTDTLPWRFAGRRKVVAKKWNIFLAPSCCVLLGLGRTHGISLWCRQRPAQKILGTGRCTTQRRSGPGWGTRWVSPNIAATSSPPNWGRCHTMFFLPFLCLVGTSASLS